jgi:hypothetical protein
VTDLAPADLEQLAFSDFAGASVSQVADYLYATEPNYMSALEADIRVRGITEAVELLGAHLVVRGCHRVAAAWRAQATVPSAPYGHSRTPHATVQHYWWAALRRRFPKELAAWRRHDPHSWTTLAGAAS